jgi:hypothetical protein
LHSALASTPIFVFLRFTRPPIALLARCARKVILYGGDGLTRPAMFRHLARR